MITAITVDLWQTLLVDPTHNLTNGRRHRLESVGRLLARGGCRVTFDALERAYDESGRRLTTIWAANQDISASDQVRLYLDCLETGLAARIPGELLTEIEQAYTTPALRFPPVLASGAVFAIEALYDQGVTLAIISNTGRTPGAVLRQILATYGLLEKFAALTFSDEALVRKPHPRIFQRTLDALGFHPSRAVHVGDDVQADVGGAKGAGMRAIHLSENGHRSNADATIRSLFELPEILARL